MFKSNESLETVPMLDGQKCSNYGLNIPPQQVDPRYTYPKAVIFILCSKFFESFAANGVRTVLALYLRDSLNFSEDFSTSVLHIFNFFSQFCPIFGAIIADNYFGNAKTIFIFFIFYPIGWIGMVWVTFPIGGIPFVPMLFTSLILISIGNGNIRACITSLGGHQFKLPQQSEALDTYFSHYYFMYYMGILLSKIVPPAIRADTQCFGKDECYAAVFGFLATIFLCCWIIFVIGMFFYKKEERNTGERNICQVAACIWYAFIRKLKDRCGSRTGSFMEASIGKYPDYFVADVISFLRVIKLFLPLPIYWSLLAQQDSTWTFQAAQMNTNLFGLKIEPDQAKALGPILILTMIPIWKQIVLPVLNKMNYRLEPLQSVAAGAVCSALSFVCAGFLQHQIEWRNYQNISTIPIAWQIPQFFLLMMGEILLSIPGLQFSYTQAPTTMKSVLTAAWFLNCAIGNLMVVAITEMNLFQRQSNEFFFYAIFMFVATIIFSYFASFYEYERTNHEVNSFNQKITNVHVSKTQSEDV